jgi:hypothetical protein
MFARFTLMNTKLSSDDNSLAGPKNPARYLFLAGALLLITWLGVKSWRIGQIAQGLQARQNQVEQILSEGVANIEPDKVRSLVMDTRRDVVVFKSQVSLFLPLATYLSWLPKVGPLLAASPELLEMADAGTEAAAFTYRGLEPGLTLLKQDQPSSSTRLTELVHVLESAKPDLVQANQSVVRFAAARSELGETASLPWRVRTLIDRIDEWLPMGQAYLKLATVLPDIMGSQGSRRYLVVAQNEDELRPTGGFISGAGILGMENGRIVELTFQDAYQVDDWRNKPYDFPPQPLYDLMGLELFLFRDSNFWPDFPTSAESMMRLYRYGQESPPLDGVIAIDQRFAQFLLAATGPVYVEESGIKLDSESVLESFREAWSFQGDPESAEWLEWYRDRKSFIGTFASAVQDKIEHDIADIDPLLLAQSIYQATQGKHLQVYSTVPEVGEVLDEINWDGRIQYDNGQDVLMVVDTNVGYTKANYYLRRNLVYQVRITPGNQVRSSLSVHFQHSGVPGSEPCNQLVSYAFDIVNDYLNLANRCYWNYLRTYAPAGSELLASSTHHVPLDTLLSGKGWQGGARTVDEMPGVTTFANYLMVPRGQSLESTFSYQLPADTITVENDDHRYELQLIKQAGMPSTPVRIIVSLPDGTELASATPPPTQIDGQDIVFEFILEHDTLVITTYR